MDVGLGVVVGGVSEWAAGVCVCVCVCWEGCGSQDWGWVSFCAGGSWRCGIDVKLVRVAAVLRMAWMGIWGW